jgi:hypothetical protein
VASSISISTDVTLSILLTIASPGALPPIVAAIEGIFLPLSILQAAKGADQEVRGVIVRRRTECHHVHLLAGEHRLRLLDGESRSGTRR